MEEDQQRLGADPDLETYLQDVLLGVTRQQSSQPGIWEFLQRAGAEALPQASHVHVNQSLLAVVADPARYALRHHGYCVRTSETRVETNIPKWEHVPATAATSTLEFVSPFMRQHRQKVKSDEAG